MTNRFKVYCDSSDGKNVFSKTFATFDEARKAIVALLETKAQDAERAENVGNVEAFRTAAAAWAQQTDETLGDGMLGDGMVYGICEDEETALTLRQALEGSRARFSVDFFAWGKGPFVRADFDPSETSCRYGRDYDATEGPEGADLVGSRYLVGSDYSGGALVRANVRAVDEILGTESALVVKAYGGHGTVALLFRLDVEDENVGEALSILEGLEGYPVVDEEVLSTVEIEEQEAAWSDHAARDFRRALETRYGFEDGFLAEDKEALATLFRIAEGGGNPLCEHEGDGGPFFRVDEAAERLPISVVLANVGIDEGFQGGALLALEEPDEARRILRALKMAEALKTIGKEIATGYRQRSEGDEGTGAEIIAWAARQGRRDVFEMKIDEGDFLAPLDGPALDRKADRAFTVDGILVDPFDPLSVQAAGRALAQKARV